MKPWPELKWWDSGERQVVEEKIDDLVRSGTVCNPSKARMYDALKATSCGETRVCIIGQDPYPASPMATGIAFSIPRSIVPAFFPASLRIIFDEYHSDLHYPIPHSGELTAWTQRGVLLWNAIPSVQAGHPLSNDWDEWEYLNKELLGRLSDKGIVFVFLGSVARRYEGIVDQSRNKVIVTSHPSPRGIRNSKTPFTGSRLFSRVNAYLRELNLDIVNWRLDNDNTNQSPVSRPELGRSRILPNITGAVLDRPERPVVSARFARMTAETRETKPTSLQPQTENT